MKSIDLIRFALTATFALALFTLGVSQQFDWMPSGGNELLVQATENCGSCDDVETLLATERTEEEWREYFEGQDGALEGMSENSIRTLAGYLALAASPDGGGSADDLPDDGRLLSQQQCMICHSIAAPMTQGWTVERWMSHFGSGTHSTIRMPESRARMIANYLAHNSVSPEVIPAALRENDPAY